MNPSATRERPGKMTFLAMRMVSFWRKLRTHIRKFVPMGYQDDSGFHLGSENPGVLPCHKK